MSTSNFDTLLREGRRTTVAGLSAICMSMACTGPEPVTQSDRPSRDATADTVAPSNDGATTDGASSCGNESQPCCVGSMCNAALVCEVNVCRAQTTCGADAQPCCVGSSCRSGFVCASGTCRPTTACGGLSQSCCSGACESGLRCLADRCEACGGAMQACCGGGACGSSLSCVADRCQACGGLNQLCCGSACTAGTECMAGMCRGVDRDMDGSPSGVDCDDNNPLRAPGRRELCDNVDNDCNTTVDDGNACGLWVHTGASGSWAAYPLDAMAETGAPSPHAPTSAIRFALDIESLAIAYVFTDTTHHLLDVRTRQWTASGPRDALIAQLAGRNAFGGYTVPAGHGGGNPAVEGAAILTTTGVINAQFDIPTRRWSFVSEAGIPTDWAPPENAPTYSNIRASWLDIANADNWVTTSPMALCMTTTTRIGPYGGVIAGDRVHVFEAGTCNRWAPSSSFASFAPFTRPGTPPLARIASTFFQGGQLVVLGTR